MAKKRDNTETNGHRRLRAAIHNSFHELLQLDGFLQEQFLPLKQLEINFHCLARHIRTNNTENATGRNAQQRADLVYWLAEVAISFELLLDGETLLQWERLRACGELTEAEVANPDATARRDYAPMLYLFLCRIVSCCRGLRILEENSPLRPQIEADIRQHDLDHLFRILGEALTGQVDLLRP
jgi:hypothetical protein